ncbi:MAG: ParA family protein [Staphylococcus equorum]
MTKKIVIANSKGGVSKTTTTNSMSAGLGQLGYKVLAIDLDPQGNLSDTINLKNTDHRTVYEMMKGEIKPKEAIQSGKYFDIIPSNLDLASADLEITQTGKEYRLKEQLKKIEDEYDFIIMDTPPSLGILTINAFTYADEVIIPTTAGIFATSGIKQLYQSIQTVKKYTNPNLEIGGILFTKYDKRTIITSDIRKLTEMYSEQIEANIFNTHIRASVMVEEAQANQTDIFSYNEKNNVSIDYKKFIQEYLETNYKGDN